MTRKPLSACIIQMIASYASFGGLLFWFINKKMASHASVCKEVEIPMYYIPIVKDHLKPNILRFLSDRGVLPNDHYKTIQYSKYRCRNNCQNFDRHMGYINYYDLIQPADIKHTSGIDPITHEVITSEHSIDI